MWESANRAPLPPIFPLTCPPISHHALQELREIHNKQQRQKQKELEADITQPSHDRKSTELQESRYFMFFYGYSLWKNFNFLTGIHFVSYFPPGCQGQMKVSLQHGETTRWEKLPLLLCLTPGWAEWVKRRTTTEPKYRITSPNSSRSIRNRENYRLSPPGLWQVRRKKIIEPDFNWITFTAAFCLLLLRCARS